ncbi:hypothetical protein [Pseudoprimorskyibacter insulae]|uniref:Chromosome partition protein Smc n=1 Tax=Pseudoprimorskyibacter insulae TaxID=1695997 RepID=A0A2R8AVQ0_9RHOB|nr:hypothetical protein [Pseudoprimorskyibacter insulae]SPF80096.1 hypothetical protein PRI8871_01898 [Pseudoprimorskyibacter insulae]
MTETSQELQDGIRLALEAAEAANDAAAEVDKMTTATERAAHRIDTFGSKMRPLMIGTLAGSVVVIGLASLVYFRTLSEMRTATATQLEALTMFASRVEGLDQSLTNAEALLAEIKAVKAGQDEHFAALQTRLDGMGLNLVEEANSYSEAADTLKSQIEATVMQAVDEGSQKTQDAFTAGLSDLQLAMTRLLADAVTAAPAAAPAPSSKPAAKTATPVKPKTVAVPKKPTAKARPAPRPNPFSYP